MSSSCGAGLELFIEIRAQKSDLRGAFLVGANLTDVKLIRTNLDKAIFSGVRLTILYPLS